MSQDNLIQDDFSYELEIVRKAFECTETGAVEFKDGYATEVFKETRLTLKAIKEVVRRYHHSGRKFKVVRGGEAGETKVDAEFLYHAVIDMEDNREFPKGLYIKVRIIDDDPDCPAVEIVSAHKSWMGN